MLSRGAPDYQTGTNHTPDYLIGVDMSLYLVYQNGCGLLANALATLFNGGQHRVTGHRLLTVSKTTDRDLVRHFETHRLAV